ncbi:MAG: DNRLRE domain-containing protein [Verrucomicrobiota bacterium]|nr:DNRLRE domain-containing protein [Verrucomicrobiota bacterium]
MAARLRVEPINFLNTTGSVQVRIEYAIGDLRIVPEHVNNGDYAVQIGPDFSDDVERGILIPSVRENGRALEHPLYPGTNYATAHIDYYRAGHERAGSYWIPVSLVWPNALSASVIEWDTDLAVAWFPYDRYLGGFARNSAGANGGANDLFTGSPGLALGRHFVDLGSGRALVDLRDFGIDGRTDGVLLVVGAKNEDNYALSWVNPTNGTWVVYSKDNGTDGASTEQDPLAFVYVPKNDPHLVVGRFGGNGTILLHSGAQPPFTVTPLGTGRWELKIQGHNPRFGILLVSPEGGELDNRDNIITYQLNASGDGWIIESRDLPAPTNGPFAPPLETPRGGTPVASFVFIPGPTPGLRVSPVTGLTVSEDGLQQLVHVALDTQPTAPVTISVTVNQPTEVRIEPTILTFQPEDWSQPQSITLTGLDDARLDGPQSFVLQLGPILSEDPDYAQLATMEIPGVNLDNDQAGLVVAPLAGLATDETGRTTSFTVRLTGRPGATVAISMEVEPSAEVDLWPKSLVVEPDAWDAPQIVTVGGRDDSVIDGPQPFLIRIGPTISADPAWHGVPGPVVQGTNFDNDMAAIRMEPSLAQLELVEGQLMEVTYRLASRPTAPVVVEVRSSDPARGAETVPSRLVFEPDRWDLPQGVTFRASDDKVYGGDITWSLFLTVESADPHYAPLGTWQIRAVTRDNEPRLGLSSDETWFAVGHHPVIVDPRAQLQDPYQIHYDGVVLQLEVTPPVSAADQFAIRTNGPGDIPFGLSGPDLYLGTNRIATMQGGHHGQPLVIRFTALASAGVAERVLRQIVFNTSQHEPTPRRTRIVVTAAHPDGGAHTAVKPLRISRVRLLDLQNGFDSGYGVYNGATDLQLYEARPDTPWPAGHNPDTNNPRMWLDYRDPDVANQSQVLLRFDQLVGSEPGQIPPGAHILAAELLLHVVDAGDGGPLYRMIMPWDDQTSTWRTFGYGIQPDGYTARQTYESFWGVPAVTGDTGTGVVSVGVRADVQAWVNGETNHGWVILPWNSELNPDWGNGTDGLAFSACEHPNAALRPRLRVWWMPTNELSLALFQNGVDGYQGCFDTRVRMNSPDATAATATAVFVDWAVNPSDVYNPDIVLLRFENMAGNASRQIPVHATVEMALLDLTTSNGNGYGDGGSFHAMLRPWEDTDTWNSLGGALRPDGTNVLLLPTVTAGQPNLNPNVCGGYMSFEVTSDVAAWIRGIRPNYGWAILPWEGGSDGWGLSMSEHPVLEERPRLRVYYRAISAPELLQITGWSRDGFLLILQLEGPAGASVRLQAAPQLAGPWSDVKRITLDENGRRTIPVNMDHSAAQFYRAQLEFSSFEQ